MRILSSLAFIGFLSFASTKPVEAELVYNAVADFNASGTTPAQSTNGAWTYGYSTSLGGTFVLHNTATGNYFGSPAGAAGFYTPLDGNALPTVIKNTNAGALTAGTITNWTPDLLLMHPGQGAQYSVVRFTTPTAGDYTVSSLFQGLDSKGPTTTDVHVRLNGIDLFSSNVSTYGPPPVAYSSGGSLALLAGDTLDFAVGLSANPNDNTFYYDSTGFDATISATPEPGTLVLFGVGTVMAWWLLRRKRVA